MTASERYEFLYFSQRKDNGTIEFANSKDVDNRLILPRHPETNDLDQFYLQSMLRCFDGSGDFRSNEILDAFPVLSLTTDKHDKFYKLSIARLQRFSLGKIKEDEYIGASIKHLFMKDKISRKDDDDSLLNDCLNKVHPVMYKRDTADTVECEGYYLSRIASYVPTSKYRRMKILKGWIEGAWHYYEYSIMFFDIRFVGYDDFNENIIDIKTTESCPGGCFYLETNGPFLLDKSGLYYDMFCRIERLNRNWLFTSPNNDNERDGKVLLFRNINLKGHFEDKLRSLFRGGTFRVNNVFKWNRYKDGGKFNDHYDTMFVNKSSEECSLYTLLIYIELERKENYLFLGDEELKVTLEGDRAYVIPHWVRHRVDGTGMREFIKSEIIFKNKHIALTYDQSIADAFDRSCYYMLHSVRHPQLKDVVSRSFNEINEARFYKTRFIPSLSDHLFLLKAITMPMRYLTERGSQVTEEDFSVSHITDGKYYYFKSGQCAKITPEEAIIMLSMMHLDIHPKRMFSLSKYRCGMGPRCSRCPYADVYRQSDLELEESIFYWHDPDIGTRIDQNLPPIRFPSNVSEILSVGNISVTDIKENAETTFYFASYCASRVPDTYYARLTDITASGKDGDYGSLDIAFVGKGKNIVKIRQTSFCNGVKVKNTWEELDFERFVVIDVREPPDLEGAYESAEESHDYAGIGAEGEQRRDQKKKKKLPLPCNV